MLVRKTLVIGLGSTGTEVCNELVRRLEWEFGSIKRLPWVRFCCFETDANQSKVEALQQAFHPINIDPHYWREYTSYPERFDEEIGLSKWADLETLRKLPGNAVQGGAGNIRMVGRLTFFHDPNYKAIRKIIGSEIRQLRDLSPMDALQRYKQGEGDERVSLEFAENGALRVFVLGTLCGGTCSGACVEFGYLLRALLQENDRSYLLVTLPHHQLTRADVPIAERLKKNAYTALVEMNHYLVGDGEARKALEEIRFPDRSRVDSSQHPYDIVFLAQTEGTASEKKELLNLQLADVVYYAVFAPETDPWGKAVDAQMQPERGQAYAFSTLGVSALEFPVYIIIDGCRHRLLSWAVREWLDQSPRVPLREDLEKIGFSWEKMVEGSLITEGGENLNQKLEAGIRDVVNEAKRGKLEEARKRLGELRSTFEESASSGTIGGPGSVMRAIRDYVARAPEKLREGVNRFASEDFLDLRSGGFQRMSLLLSELSKVFARIRSLEPTGTTGATDQWLNAIEDASHSLLLGMLFLRKRVRERLAERLKKALEEEMRNRKEKALVNSLKRPIGEGTYASSSLDRLQKTLEHYKERFENIKHRLTRWREKLQEEYERLRDSKPRGNGVYLFEPGKDDGTVDREFESLLSVQDPSTRFPKRWEDEREVQASRIIRNCQEFAKDLVKIPEPGEEHWLDQPRWQTDGKDPIPEKLCQELLRLASEPFQKLADINVLERWNTERDKAQIAREVISKAEPFLRVSSAEARRGSRTEYQTHAVLLVPSEDTPIRDEFMRSISSARSGYDDMDSPNPYRVVAIKYIMGFPLKAAEPIYAVNGLHSAECGDWPYFHARKDVNWRAISVGVSEKQKEIKMLFAVALLLGLEHVVKMEGGNLVAYARDPRVGSEKKLTFPLNLSETARLCEKGHDGQDQPVGDLMRVLQDAISAHLKEKGSEVHIRAIQQGYERFSSKLIPDWHDVPQLLHAYYKGNPELEEAWKRISPPPEDRMQVLWDEENQQYKCEKCGAFMGVSEEFEKNNWTCPRCGEYYGSAR